MSSADEILSFSVDSDPTRLEALQAQVADHARRSGLAQPRSDRLLLALEEIFVNICHYAYPDAPGPVWVHCRHNAEGFTVEIIDEGPPFDPTSLPEPDRSADIESRSIGGLGWFMVPRLVDRVESTREAERNVVRLYLSMPQSE